MRQRSRADVFPLVRQRFSYLRQFSPTLLEQLAFEAEPDGKGELVEAIRMLHGLNEHVFAHAGLPADPDVAVQDLKRRLGEAYDRFLLGQPKNTYVEVSAEGAWRFGWENVMFYGQYVLRRELVQV